MARVRASGPNSRLPGSEDFQVPWPRLQSKRTCSTSLALNPTVYRERSIAGRVTPSLMLIWINRHEVPSRADGRVAGAGAGDAEVAGEGAGAGAELHAASTSSITPDNSLASLIFLSRRRAAPCAHRPALRADSRPTCRKQHEPRRFAQPDPTT